MISDTFYTTDEVCKLLRVSRTTLYRYEKAGRLPAPIKLSRSTVRWSKQAMDQLIQQGFVK